MTMNNLTEGVQREGCCPPAHASDPAGDVTWGKGRTIGPWGTAVRALAGAAAIALGVAVPHEHPLLDLPGASSNLIGLLVGCVAIPLALTLAIWARGRSAPRLYLGHGAACLVTVLTIGAAQFYPVAVFVGIGAPLLLLAAIGRHGCELLAVPNQVLRRNDYLFCLPFSPVDAWERRRRAPSPAVSSVSSGSPVGSGALRD
ncbi:MAG: hypothetical protein ACRDPB_05165 [Nocardioidaceae bacterium]